MRGLRDILGIGLLQETPHLLRRDRELPGNPADAPAKVLPDAQDDQLGELFLNLLEGLLSKLAFRPAAQGIVYTGGPENLDLQLREFLVKVIAIVLAKQQGSL